MMTIRMRACGSIAAVVAAVVAAGCGGGAIHDYPARAVPFTEVDVADAFWAPRIETNRTVTIPFAFEQSEQTGRIDNFEIAAGAKAGDFCSNRSAPPEPEPSRRGRDWRRVP
jgi:uncharacterized protein